MTEEQETMRAKWLYWDARGYVQHHAKPEDIEASAIALLVRALELATPGWSVLGRASLFTGEDE